MRGEWLSIETRLMDAISEAQDQLHQQRGTRFGNDVVAKPGATFATAAWAFPQMGGGEDEIRKIIDCNREQLLDVVCVLYHSLQAAQEQIEILKNKERLSECPALQLVG